MVNNLVKKASMKKVSPAPPKPARPVEVSGGQPDDHYMVRSALQTLTEAEKIRRDKKLMMKVREHAAEHKASIDAALGGGMGRARR
jgi:hypothetical protein